MNCPYCGEKVDTNKEFCLKCGNRLITHNVTTNYEINDTKELETFIDKNVNKIKPNRVSLPSLFLGSLYYLYRKMYVLGILLIIMFLSFSIGFNYVPDDYKIYVGVIYLIFSLVISIVLFIKFNSIYINHANRKINRIKTKYKNESRFEIMERIKYAGSTNLLAPAVAYLIVFGIFLFINLRINNYKDNLSNATYSVADGFRQTDAIVSLNEDNSFIWYSNKNDKEDNFYVGKYRVYVSDNAIREAKKYKIETNNIKDKSKYYVLKLNVNRQSIQGKLTDTNFLLIYYGIYDDTNNTIDLIRVGNQDYFRLVKIKE